MFAEEDFEVWDCDTEDVQHAAGGVAVGVGGEIDFGEEIRVELQRGS